jgi:hypothetical protein
VSLAGYIWAYDLFEVLRVVDSCNSVYCTASPFSKHKNRYILTPPQNHECVRSNCRSVKRVNPRNDRLGLMTADVAPSQLNFRPASLAFK